MNDRVAIIGAGPAGLATAKFLLAEGLHPVLFDQSDRVGGQWHTGNSLSGIWPGMPTNTSRIMTRFSDLAYPEGVPIFPRAEQVLAYLENYTETFGICRYLRLNTRVEKLSRSASGEWSLRFRDPTGAVDEQVFAKVVIATGRFNSPKAAATPGLELDGTRHAHSADYKGPANYRGQHVLVAGSAISALEIASDLAMNGAASVVSVNRGQRYVIDKVFHGVPTDHLHFNLYEALLGETLDPDLNAERMKQFVLESMGSPNQYGAPVPDADLRIAGLTKCEHFLPLVAEGRIEVRDWPQRLSGGCAYFSDGGSRTIDRVILATGYKLDLPFLDSAATATLSLDDDHIALYQHTLHPDLPGLALVGFYNQVGPYFPVLELQARWIAYMMSGRLDPPSAQQLQKGLVDFYNSWKQPQKLPMHQLALRFSREMGVFPDLSAWKESKETLLFGPLSATLFRLNGPDALRTACGTLDDEAGKFGMVDHRTLCAEDLGYLDRIELAHIPDRSQLPDFEQ